jgi:hypothetical protein
VNCSEGRRGFAKVKNKKAQILKAFTIDGNSNGPNRIQTGNNGNEGTMDHKIKGRKYSNIKNPLPELVLRN